MENSKVCPKCLMRKSLDEFKSRPDGTPSGYCYKCELEYYRTYNVKRYASEEARQAELDRSKAKYHASIKPKRIERKRMMVEIFGGKCQRCGYSNNVAALDFHHKKPASKLRTVSHLLSIQKPWAWDEAVKEAAKCELLCSNCHREETHPDWQSIEKGQAAQSFEPLVLCF